MTVSSIEPVNNYAGNNSATRFDFDFFIENENELLVQHTNATGYQTTLKLNTDYTINEIGSENGSYIIFPIDGSDYSVLKEGEVITLSLDLKIVQEKEFKNSSKLSLKVLESAFDYLTRLIQILNRKVERAVKVKEGVNISPDNLMEDINKSVNDAFLYSEQSKKSFQNAQLSAQLAKEWAIKEEKVEETDYSSKYYAEKSKESAQLSEEKAQETNEIYQTAKQDIQKQASEKIDEINDEADKQFKRIQSLGFYQKDNKFYYTNELGEETSLRFEKTDNIFDLVSKDHILSYEEKEGLERLGEYVYKEASDRRYGYADFYNKCIEEYNNLGNTKETVYVSSNIINNDLIDNNGVIYGFNTARYATINNQLAPEEMTTSWEFVIKVKMPNVADNCAIIGSGAGAQKYGLTLRTNTVNQLILYVSGNAINWNIANGVASIPKFELGKEYLIKITYSLTGGLENQTAVYSVDLSENIDNYEKTWTNYITKEITNISSSTNENTYKIADYTPTLGIDYNVAFINGKIDLNKCYIKQGEIISWQGVKTVEVLKYSNGHKFYDIQDKEKIDEIYKNTGVAWYYGIDTENERVLLPRNDYFFQNNKNAGKYIEAGLPNITGDWCAGFTLGLEDTAEGNGAITSAFEDSRNYNVNNNSGGRYSLDASLSNSIYGNSTTVQPPSVGVVIYMVVGNTTVTQAQTNITEITTSENDTIPLFTGQYFDFKPNHLSWLQAGTQVSGKVYESAYNELVNILNKTEQKYGESFKVVDEKQKLPDTDYSEYWVINEDNQTFRAPLKTSLLKTISNARILINKKEPTEDDPAWYNLYSDGWLEQGGKATNMKSNEQRTINLLKPYADTSYSVFHSTQITNQTDVWGYGNRIYNSTVNSFTLYINSSTSGNVAWKTQGYTTPPTAQEIAKSENIGLYFKVSNALENIEVINAGFILENCVFKTQLVEAQTVIETYQNWSSGYRIWSDGWCEQWGRVSSGQSNINVSFLKAFSNTNYNAQATSLTNANEASSDGSIGVLTATGMTIINNGYRYPMIWKVEGYLAEGTY